MIDEYYLNYILLFYIITIFKMFSILKSIFKNEQDEYLEQYQNQLDKNLEEKKQKIDERFNEQMDKSIRKSNERIEKYRNEIEKYKNEIEKLLYKYVVIIQCFIRISLSKKKSNDLRSIPDNLFDPEFSLVRKKLLNIDDSCFN